MKRTLSTLLLILLLPLVGEARPWYRSLGHGCAVAAKAVGKGLAHAGGGIIWLFMQSTE